MGLTGSYNITDHWQVSGAVMNVRDTRPPANLPNYGGMNYSPTYSQAGIVGRFFRLGAHYKFVRVFGAGLQRRPFLIAKVGPIGGRLLIRGSNPPAAT